MDMKLGTFVITLHLLAIVGVSQQQPPREWIDPDTGHRVIRLSEEPGSASLYFIRILIRRMGRN